MLTKEYLEGKLASLQSQFEQLKNNLNATNGAIQLVQHLLSELETEAKQLAEKAKEEIQKL